MKLLRELVAAVESLVESAKCFDRAVRDLSLLTARLDMVLTTIANNTDALVRAIRK
jgi:ABC-type transporter Mla subunit MlaD